VRHAARAAGGAMIGASVERVPGTSAPANEREKVPEDGVASSVSDAAQQRSAWVCVTTRAEFVPGSAVPCIGQSSLSVQQAMRASGEACQPAHSAHPAAASVRATTKAGVRLNSSSTSLGCASLNLVSIQSTAESEDAAI